MTSPNLNIINKRIENFKGYVQKVLPAVYDDSLSYYELLSKIITHLNENGKLTNEMVELWNDVYTWLMGDGLKEEVSVNINKLILDGFFDDLIDVILLDGVKTRLQEVTVNVKDFGAIGDGVADDTQAFKDANLFGYYKTRLATVLNASVMSYQVYVPAGIYRVNGHRIFGSPLGEGTKSENIPPITLKVHGDNASIMWGILSTTDELFYFDGTIDKPQISGLNIFPVSDDSTISIGGTVFKYHQDLSSLGYANASKGYYENVHINLGRPTSNTGFSTKVSKVFHNIGYGMSDQTVVKNCSFQYFERMYVGENPEAVNWTFENCNIFPGGFTSSIVFDFTSMFDNFNVLNCAFSMSSDEKMIRTRSTVSNALYTQSSLYNFNFDNNRLELYGASTETWDLADMNFGRLNMRNTNMRLGSGANLIKTFVKGSQLACFNFENVAFNNVEFYIPIPTAQAFTGALQSVGCLLKSCDFINGQYTFKYSDGITVYNMQDVLVNNSNYFRNLIVENCTISNRNGVLNFEIMNTSSELQMNNRNDVTSNYSLAGVGVGKVITLPPYRMIKKIVLSGVGALPGTYTSFRIYFGDKALNKFVDVPNSSPSTAKDGFVLWEGLATVFNNDLTKQSISVYALNDGVEAGEFRSQIEITHAALDPKVFGISTNENTVVIKNKS